MDKTDTNYAFMELSFHMYHDYHSRTKHTYLTHWFWGERVLCLYLFLSIFYCEKINLWHKIYPPNHLLVYSITVATTRTQLFKRSPELSHTAELKLYMKLHTHPTTPYLFLPPVPGNHHLCFVSLSNSLFLIAV